MYYDVNFKSTESLSNHFRLSDIDIVLQWPRNKCPNTARRYLLCQISCLSYNIPKLKEIRREKIVFLKAEKEVLCLNQQSLYK